jgi:t-SNARE complex subunit (syntaxin)
MNANKSFELNDKEIYDLESDIDDIYGIYKNIDEIINAQGILLDKIEDNMDLATLQVIDAKNELTDANYYYKSYKTYQYILYGFAVIGTLLFII